MALARTLDRPDRDTKRRLRLWLRLYAATSLVEREMRRFLRTRFATTLPRFDLMAARERAPEGLSMGDLSHRLMVTGGNVTAVVDSLERDGLVARRQPASDRRTSYVALTSPGRAAFAAMAREHEQWIDRLLAKIPDDEIDRLAGLLADLKHGAEAEERAR
jgi:DNA-binding MarR family transcriptional regulator